MPLYEADIRTMQAEDLSQNATAGGRMGSSEVHNGQVGNVFARLGREDRAAGAVDLAKLYLWGDSDDRTEAHNASTILTSRPADPRVSMVLFRPGAVGDRALHSQERGAAQSYVEAYLLPGEPLMWYVWGQHALGSPELRLWSRVSNAAQPPQVGDVLYIDATALDASPDSDRYYQVTDMSTERRTIALGDGASVEADIVYLGINKPLAAALSGITVAEGDAQAPDPGVFGTVVADAARFYGVQPLAAAADDDESVVKVASVYDHIVPTQTADISLGNPLAVATLTQTITTGGRAVQVAGNAHSAPIEITAANRSTTYTRTLAPIPATGTIQVHYRALGRWYVITEADSGAYGSITRIDADTMTATLLERPDADTAVLVLWATPVHYLDIAGSTAGGTISHVSALPTPVEPGSASVQWLSGTVTRTATVATSGAISGDGAAGYLVHATGEYWIAWDANIPDSGADLAWTYEEMASAEEVFTGLTPTAGVISFSLADEPLPGSLAIIVQSQERTERVVGGTHAIHMARIVTVGNWRACGNIDTVEGESWDWGETERRSISRTYQEDGAGNIWGTEATASGTLVGQAVSLNVEPNATFDRYFTGEHAWNSVTEAETFGGPVVARYQVAGTMTVSQTYTESLPALSIDLQPLRNDPLYPGSVVLRLGATTYRDEGDGNLYGTDGAVLGTIDYIAGRAHLSEWSSSSPTVTLVSGLIQRGQPQQTDFAFRTAGAPIVAGELGIQATGADGTAISIQVPTDGSIAEAEITGTARHDIGLAYVSFTAPVWPGTVRYSGTIRKTIPMDPDLVGLDPTRLGDGRVPIYRVGDLVVIQEWHEESLPGGLTAGQEVTLAQTELAQVYLYDGAGEQTQQLPTGLSGGQVIDLGATRLEYCLLRDADGRNIPGGLFAADLETGVITMAAPLSLDGYTEPLVARYLSRVDPDLWEVDLAAGEITMASPLDLSAYTQPLLARYRIEDERVISDVQITGELAVSQPLSHDYTTAAVASSKLRHGDLQARVDPTWSQNTWTGVWDDELIGSAPTGGGQYDDTAYPPLVTNHGAITERWRLSRRSDGQWDVIGETVGLQAVWSGAATLEVEYRGRIALTMYHEGLGGGWGDGNQIRVNTYGCQGPFWALRCTRPGAADRAEDAAELSQRVDAD